MDACPSSGLPHYLPAASRLDIGSSLEKDIIGIGKLAKPCCPYFSPHHDLRFRLQPFGAAGECGEGAGGGAQCQ